MAVPLTPLALSLIQKTAGMGINWLRQQAAVDRSLQKAISAAVREATANEPPPERPSLPTDLLGNLPVVPMNWVEWTTMVLSQASLDFPPNSWDASLDPVQELVAALERGWSKLSISDQESPLSDADWRHSVAEKTVELLPRMLEAEVPGVGAAEMMANVLEAARGESDSRLLNSIKESVGELATSNEGKARFDERLEQLPRTVGEWLRRLSEEDAAQATDLARRLADGDPISAVKSLLASKDPASLSPYAWLGIADFAVAHCLTFDAVAAYEHAVSQGASDSWRILTTAAGLLLESDSEKANDLLQKAAAHGATGQPYYEAQTSLHNKDYKSLLKLTDEVSSASVDASLLLAYRAQVQCMAGRLDEGLASFERSLSARPESTSVAILAARAYLARSVSDGALDRRSDLRRARELAISARDERRRWGGDSGEALQWALASLDLEGDWDAVKSLSIAGADPIQGPTSGEARNPGVQRAAFIATLASNEPETARFMATEISDPFEGAMAKATVSWLIDSDREQALVFTRQAWESAKSPQDQLRVQQFLATTGEIPAEILDEELSGPLLATAEMAQGRYEDAIGRLRPLRHESLQAARTLAEAYRAIGDVDRAVETLDAAADDFAHSSLKVLATEMLYSAAQLERVLERASQISVESPIDSKRLSEVAAQAAGQLGDWERVVEIARSLLNDEPDNVVIRWALVAGLAHQARFEPAWRQLRENLMPLLPTNEDLALVALELLRRHGTGQDTLAYVLDIARAFPAEQVRAASLIVAYEVSRDLELSERELQALHSATNQFFDEFPESAMFRRIQFSTPDELVQQLADNLSKDGADFKRIAHDVSAGHIPYAMLPAVAGRPYAESLVRRAIRILPLEYPDSTVAQLEVEAAQEAIKDQRTVLEPSVLLTASYIGDDLWRKVSAIFHPLKLPIVCVHDLARGSASLALRSTSSVWWDDESQMLVMTEASSDDAEDLAQRSSWMMHQASLLDPEPWRTFESLSFDAQTTLETMRAGEWLAPLDTAKSQNMALWSDDRSIRSLARGEGVAAFGTVALFRALQLSGQLTAADVDKATLELRRAYAVDLEMDQEQLTTLASSESSTDYRAVLLTFSRAASWHDPIKTFAIVRRLFQISHRWSDDSSRRIERLGSLISASLSAISERFQSVDTSGVDTGLLASAIADGRLTSADIAPLIAWLRNEVEDDRVDRMVSGSAQQLSAGLRGTSDSATSAQGALSLFAHCDDRTRQRAMEGLLDVRG